MANRSVVCVAGDMGAASAVKPSADVLVRRGYRVRWIADHDGEGRKLLAKEGVSGIVSDPAEVGSLLSQVEAVVVGTSASATGCQRHCTERGLALGRSVAWVEDFPGTANGVHDISPNQLLVSIPHAIEMARRFHPGVDVRVVGQPAFAARKRLIEQARKGDTVFRQPHWVKSFNFVVLLWTGGESIERAEAHVDALRALELEPIGPWEPVLVPRIHPKLDRIKAGTVDRLREKVSSSSLLPVLDWRNTDVSVATAMANVVVCDWCVTECYFAPLMGRLTFACLFPHDLERLQSRGMLGGTPPHVAAGATRGALSVASLCQQIRAEYERVVKTYVMKPALPSGQLWREAERHFGTMLNQDAAERIADCVEELCA